MTRKILFFFFLFCGFLVQAQKTTKEFRSKKITVTKDSIQLDSVSINPNKFNVLNAKNISIPKSDFQVDFSKAILIINSKKYTKITVEYFRYPEFITKTYTPFDKKLIVPNTSSTGKLYSLTTNKKASQIKLFDGLDTQGFIARGVTVGNNQNAVTNSSLDLNISGKLSDKVSLRANIFDTNIPLQQNGYSQNITDFDRIFIELFSKNWRIKGGDISLQNNNSYFMTFNKQVSGLEVSANINESTNVSASGAVVRGKFSEFKFTGTEGNQGPYKLLGTNNEPAIVIISGSEQVFVNGVRIGRGEQKEYIIDYNLAEIRFNTTFPITNDMRIHVQYQISDRNYTRFITYEKASYSDDNFSINGYFYSENDAKNQPLQQNLSEEQKQILANAGNNSDLMIAESAFEDAYNENRILYKKVLQGAIETFEYTTDANETLFNVTFTNFGQNNGDYAIDTSTAIGTIFKYVGVNLGSYNPIIRLVAPTKSQVFVLNSAYRPSDKIKLNTEIAISNSDANLFSKIDDQKNTGIAVVAGWEQILIDKKWQLKTNINHEYVQENFKTIQRWESVEFNRDWNLISNTGTKNLFQSEFLLKNKKNDSVSYQFKHLNYAEKFNGNKHEVSARFTLNHTTLTADGSLLNSTSTIEKGNFIRANAKIEHSFGKSWAGALTAIETNDLKNTVTNNYSLISHKFKEYETYFGLGDTTKIYAKFGINYRTNDSIRTSNFSQINNRKTFYIDSKLIKNKQTDLSVYANFRQTENAFTDNEKSLNSRIVYQQRLFDNLLIFGTTYETLSGTIARQDYVYVETEPGLGFYTWIDYNNDSIKQFNEFEVAQFQDQANYLRIALPNLKYLPTQRAKLKQSITLNPVKWKTKTGLKKTLSHFYNQTYLLVDNEQERVGDSFNFNPFNLDASKLLNLTFNFRNSLYFNRNLQDYSFIYTYGKSRNKQEFGIGSQENKTNIHQLEFQQKLSKFWLFDLKTALSENNLATQNFSNRNYLIQTKEINPKFTFLYHKDHRFSMFYHFKNKENKVADFEALQQQKFGADYFFISKKGNQINASVNIFLNDFTGNSNSPVGYQLLEGLQAGKNYTWNLLFSQKLNSFLNLNMNYLGRKSEGTNTIHTGTIQLKAIF